MCDSCRGRSHPCCAIVDDGLRERYSCGADGGDADTNANTHSDAHTDTNADAHTNAHADSGAGARGTGASLPR